MCPRPQYSDLIYMRGTRSCRPIYIIIINNTKGYYKSLNMKMRMKITLSCAEDPSIPIGFRWEDRVDRQSIFNTNQRMGNIYKPMYK